MKERPQFQGRIVAVQLIAKGVINFEYGAVAVGVISRSFDKVVVVTDDGQIWMVPHGAVELDPSFTLQ